MSDNAPSLPQTTDAGGAVSTAVSNKAVLELTEDEKSALENMSGMDKAVLLMLSLSEEDAAQIFKNLEPKQVQKLGIRMSECLLSLKIR